MAENPTRNTHDTRPIRQVVYEKSVFGAVPTHYQVNGDPRWHPVQFVANPDLASVSFSDGSQVYVEDRATPATMTQEEMIRAITKSGVAEREVAPLGGLTASQLSQGIVPGSRHPLPELNRDDLDDSDFLEMLAAANGETVTESLAEQAMEVAQAGFDKVDLMKPDSEPMQQEVQIEPTFDAVTLDIESGYTGVAPLVNHWNADALTLYTMHRAQGMTVNESFEAADIYFRKHNLTQPGESAATGQLNPNFDGPNVQLNAPDTSDLVRDGLASIFPKAKS